MCRPASGRSTRSGAAGDGPSGSSTRAGWSAARALAALAAAVLAATPATAETAARAAAGPPAEVESYQLVLLKRPARPTDHPEEKLAEIQGAHLAHLTRLGEEGKIVIAGPFSDQEDESLRGLALYRVGSLEEARRLAEADPAVQAGRLEVEAVTWWVEKGYMTFPKAPPAEPDGEASRGPDDPGETGETDDPGETGEASASGG